MSEWDHSSDATYQAQVAALQAALPQTAITPASGAVCGHECGCGVLVA